MRPFAVSIICRWPEFVISIQKLCSGDWDRSIRISVWDWNRYNMAYHWPRYQASAAFFTCSMKICAEFLYYKQATMTAWLLFLYMVDGTGFFLQIR